MLIEHLHHLGEVEQRAAEAVDLVDDHAVDLACGDVGHEAFQRRAVHVAAGEPAIVVVLGDALPAFVTLGGDVRFSRFSLGIEGVELLLQSFFGTLPRVDGTPHDRVLGGDRNIHARHQWTPVEEVSWKNRFPLQWEPVICLAIALSDR